MDIIFLLFLREGEVWLIFSYVSTYPLLSFEGGECGVWLIFHTCPHIFCCLLREGSVAHICPHILFEGGNCGSFFRLVHIFLFEGGGL